MLTRARKMMYRARGYVNGSLNGEAFRLDPYHSKFWHKASAGNWEPETFAVLDAHLDKDHDYIDIGAWIGPTVLYAARKARHVWCFEPDPVAYRHLVWNLDLNDIRNVSAFGIALSDDVRIARMASFGGEAGDSMSSLLSTDDASASDVMTIGWEHFASSVDLSAVSLVKMDIEGAEFDVLPTLLPWLEINRPALYLSVHAPFLDANRRQSALQKLVKQLAFYGRCLDQNGKSVLTEELTSEESETRFRSFAFSS